MLRRFCTGRDHTGVKPRRPSPRATCSGVPEVGLAEEAELRPHRVETDVVATGGKRPDDVQHLTQEPGSYMTTLGHVTTRLKQRGLTRTDGEDFYILHVNTKQSF